MYVVRYAWEVLSMQVVVPSMYIAWYDKSKIWSLSIVRYDRCIVLRLYDQKELFIGATNDTPRVHRSSNLAHLSFQI